jgi:hypothetical protein
MKRGRRIYRDTRKEKAEMREGGGKEDEISKERQQDTIEERRDTGVRKTG